MEQCFELGTIICSVLQMRTLTELHQLSQGHVNLKVFSQTEKPKEADCRDYALLVTSPVYSHLTTDFISTQLGYVLFILF